MKKLIAIDDGHGMQTAGKRTPVFTDGTTGETGQPWFHENEFNRDVARQVKANLERCSFRTLLVAPTDEDTPRKMRTDIANKANADLFISIHANALNGAWGDQQGVSAFHYPASVQGKKAADIIQKYLLMGTKQKDRKTQIARFDVLSYTNMPAVLVECAFMDNLHEAKLLMSDAFRRECAEEIVRGICEYFNVEYKDVEPMKYQKIRRYGSNVHIVEMDPMTYRLDITEGVSGKLEKLSAMYGEPRLDEIVWVRMNAQFFGGSSRGYGAFIDPTDSLPDKPSAPGYTDLTYKDSRLCIGTGEDFTVGTSYGLISKGVNSFINAAWFPAIMAARHPRSMAGCLENGNNVFIVVDGRWLNLSLGMTAQQQADLGHVLGCVELTNFDGGGSSQIIIGDEIKNRPSDGKERTVVSAIVAYRKYTFTELPMLKKGKTGMYVNLLQRLLNDADCNAGFEDGIFGNGTLAAVKKYQKQYGLVADGIVGKLTWAALTSGKM